MEQSNLTNFGNLSYTARRAVGHDSKGSFSVFWKTGVKEAEKICREAGIRFYMTINKETEMPLEYLQKMRELEGMGIIHIRVR